MNLEQATGPGGTDMLSALGQTAASDGASMTGDLQADDSNHGGLAHGVVMALGTLVAAPIDIITAGALARWPVLHMITSTAVLAFILAGMGLGIQLSRLYVEVSLYRVWNRCPISELAASAAGQVLTPELRRPNNTGRPIRFSVS